MANLYLYPVWVRLWHLLNAIFCLLLIVSGLSLQYASVESSFIGFETAIQMHNVSGIGLTLSYIGFFVGNMFSSNGKFYRINKRGMLNRLMSQFRYYTNGVFKNEKPPFPVTEERKFNPLQKLTYIITMYIFVPIVMITGWALLFPELVIARIFNVSGLFLNDLLHITIGFCISIFLVVHVYFCTIGATKTSNFKSMMSGWHQSH